VVRGEISCSLAGLAVVVTANCAGLQVHLERMVSVKAFVDKIEAMVKDFHAGSPARVIKQPAKKDPFFASLYESDKDRKKREKRESKEQKKASGQQDRTKKVKKNGTNGCLLVAPFTLY
jgi:anion-transporting  ArsA/GET3 family ATPase